MPDPAEMGLVECPECRASVLPRPYCSVCGQSLQGTGRAGRFAADPSEAAVAVRLVSTLFPQLPKADMDAFRLALGLGVGVLVVLVALGYLAVALVAGAVLVPLLLGVYLYSVDVYEDEPIRVIMVTLVWGAFSGAVFGLALRELFPGRVGPSPDEDLVLVVRVLITPLVALGLMLAGPLALVRYRKFDDVLDGATFGAVSGATFVGAQIVAQSLDLVTAGPQPGGETWSWVMRIVEHGVAVPLIAGGAVAGACGAFWLRYRAPVRDRAARPPRVSSASERRGRTGPAGSSTTTRAGGRSIPAMTRVCCGSSPASWLPRHAATPRTSASPCDSRWCP